MSSREVSILAQTGFRDYLDDLTYVYQLEAEAEAARRGELKTVTMQELGDELGLTEMAAPSAPANPHGSHPER